MSAIQFVVVPTFGHLSFADSARVEDAVRVVVAVRLQQRAALAPPPPVADVKSRAEGGGGVDPKERETMVALVLNRLVQAASSGGVLSAIVSTANAAAPPNGSGGANTTAGVPTPVITVGDLRRLTDHEWRALDLPAMARLYLKFLVRQSGRSASASASSSAAAAAAAANNGVVLSFIDKLQNDFNFGQPFDMSLYSGNIQLLSAMGFKRDECLESLVMTDNKGIEPALELLFCSDMSLRRAKREAAVERLGRQKSAIGGGPGSTPVDGADSDAAVHLQSQLASVRRQLEGERQLRTQLETQIRNKNLATPIPPQAAYREYVRGLLVDEISQIRTYRATNNISAADSAAVLKELGVAQERLESSKRFDTKTNSDCVICLDQPKNHVLMPCMHLCLCGNCVQKVMSKSGTCPVCTKKVSTNLRVYI